MKIVSSIFSIIFFSLSAIVLFFWFKDYRNTNKHFSRKSVIFRVVLVITTNLSLIFMLITSELSLKNHVDVETIVCVVKGVFPEVLLDILFIDIPYFYMMFARKE